MISVDDNGLAKIWDPSRKHLERRVWYGRVGQNVTAAGVTDDGSRIAVAIGLKVTIHDVKGDNDLVALECVSLNDLDEKVVSLQFTDDDHVVAHDAKGKKITIVVIPPGK